MHNAPNQLRDPSGLLAGVDDTAVVVGLAAGWAYYQALQAAYYVGSLTVGAWIGQWVANWLYGDQFAQLAKPVGAARVVRDVLNMADGGGPSPGPGGGAGGGPPPGGGGGGPPTDIYNPPPGGGGEGGGGSTGDWEPPPGGGGGGINKKDLLRDINYYRRKIYEMREYFSHGTWHAGQDADYSIYRSALEELEELYMTTFGEPPPLPGGH